MAQDRLFRLDDHVALIAGGSGAIGAAIGEALGRAGASVAIAGRSSERTESAAARVRDAGAEALPLVADVNDPMECERLVGETGNRFGRLDMGVHAVGRGPGPAL